MAALLAANLSHYSPEMVTRRTEDAVDEAALIRLAQGSDRKAFEALYRLHVSKVYGLCLRMTGNTAEAEDCTQDAFIQAWKQLGKFRGASAFATWLLRIAVNTVLGRMRKSGREQDRIQVAAEMSAAPLATGDTGEMRALAEAIDRLPSGARHVFVLHAVYGYSHDEAGSMLGIATGTSKAQLHRARQLLSQQLTEQGFEK